ncbi:Sapep family Mn(2+)-dependent dipeptidase [Oscillospiraceae bacterium CM]|nr:Sapep family Mn(2+)-dependent dipeptidase [Oscillospiraceae bacterium CM]
MKNNTQRQEIDAWFEKEAPRLVEDVKKLIAIKSVRGEPVPGMPYGEGPAAALNAAAALLSSYGFTVHNFENRVITADLNDREPALGILAHLDVVAAGEGWTTDPFTPSVQDGKIFGRGAADDKGPAVAALFALRAARDLAPPLAKGCRLILGSAEETGHDDLAHYRRQYKLPPNVFTPDASYPIVNTEKGRLILSFSDSWDRDENLPRVVSLTGGTTPNIVPHKAEAVVFGLPLETVTALCADISIRTGAPITAEELPDGVCITVHGKAAHAMAPEEGTNAQTALVWLLSALPLPDSLSFTSIKALNRLFPHGDTRGVSLGIAASDALSGPLTLNFGCLALDETGFCANFDCRMPEEASGGAAENGARRALEKAGFAVTDAVRTAYHHTPSDGAFVKTLLRIYEDYTGNKGACLAFGGSTYVHDVDGGVAFGCAFPGVDNRLHAHDEFIDIVDLIQSAKMFTQAILDLCKAP